MEFPLTAACTKHILLQYNSIAYVEWSAQLGQIAETRQKIRSMKLTEHYLLLQRFDEFSMSSAFNDRKRKSSEAWKNS